MSNAPAADRVIDDMSPTQNRWPATSFTRALEITALGGQAPLLSSIAPGPSAHPPDILSRVDAPQFSHSEVQRLVERILGSPPTAVAHLPVGWGNDNWRVSVEDATHYVLKLGPPGSAKKWQATNGIYRSARSVSLPVPDLIHFDAENATVGGWTVRLFTWMIGTSPQSVLRDGPRTTRFFTDLGTMTRALHDLPTEAFSSRLDGSAPSFDRWDEYLRWRLPRILDRVHRTQAFTASEIEPIADTIEELAIEVEPYARPSLCHRDLYLDNLLATQDGQVAALLDFDGAEAWDSAIDVVKLRWLVFPDYPGSEAAFNSAYGQEPAWAERVRLAELVELVNAVPNAIMNGDAQFEDAARSRLDVVLND